ncbi:MAG: hypothetical protein K2Y22_06220 [Candidatus Obscuribacterales bacterium]|nr:hypothetical protein [Candidatus Obscuribacterales bacterium]
MPLIVEKEHGFSSTGFTEEFLRISSIEVPVGSRVVEVRSTGCNVTVTVQQPVPDATETLKDETIEFHMYKTGIPYRRPSSTEFKFWGIVGANEGKCAIYEKR